MPKKPLKPCAYPGCPKLTEKTYCPEHEKEMMRQYEKHERDPLHGKRYGHNWHKVRSAYVAAHPLCERCAKQGRYVPVEEVHHIVPLRDGGTNDWSNLMSLCRKCHAEVHAEMGDRRNWKRPPQGEGKSLGRNPRKPAPPQTCKKSVFKRKKIWR